MSEIELEKLSSTIDFSVFQQLDVRVGVIVAVEVAEGCRVLAYKLKLDFGPLGFRQSLAQISTYPQESLIGKQILAVLNFQPRQIGKNISEVLVLGVPTDGSGITLVVPDKTAIIGSRLF